MDEPLLSICLPIYNQAESFREQIRSIANAPARVKKSTQFVIVDDCSTDDLATSLEELRASGWRYKNFRNVSNLGRASSLARSIRSAQGRYVLIMDGDDPFVEEGLANIHECLSRFENNMLDRECVGIAFGTLIEDAGITRRNALPEGLRCSLLSLRADHGVKGDIKEVVKREAALAALCPLFDRFRRVPTSLLWTRISELGPVECSSKVVVRKSYGAAGMTRNLEVLRTANVPPLLALYEGIANSRSYRSSWYRLRAAINYNRFLMRAGTVGTRLRGDFFGLAAVAGAGLGLVERMRSTGRSSIPTS